MTVLPSGRFKQGGASADTHAAPFELPQHIVLIGYSLAMSTNEITVGEFGEFIAATRREMSGCSTYDGRWEYRQDANWQAPGFAQGSTHPATCVSWDDATAYAKWLNRQERPPVSAAQRFRMGICRASRLRVGAALGCYCRCGVRRRKHRGSECRGALPRMERLPVQ